MNKLPRFQKVTLVFGAAMVTSLCLPCPTHAQSSTPQASTPQDRQAVQSDDVTHRDLARFDQFLDSHREVADQLRKTPSLVDDPQYLQSHPELNSYLQEHPSVKQEVSQQPDTFMRLEDSYGRDSNMRDRDAGGQGRVAGGQDRDAGGQDRDAGGQDRDANGQGRVAGGQDRDANGQGRVAGGQGRVAGGQDRDANGQDRDAGGQDRNSDRRDVANFNQFLDGHREVAEQVRKDPSLLDNRTFVQNHPPLQTYLQNNPGVRDQVRQDPNAFMRQEDAYGRDSNMRDRDAGGQGRDADRRDGTNDHRDVANFNRFLDGHREVAEQVRKDPSLLDNRSFVQNHAPLQAYLQDNPGVRDQVRQDPNAFMRQEDAYSRDSNTRDRDPMHDHMAGFGGFLHSHSDIQNDLSRDPSVVKDHGYVQNHAELDTYLKANPEVRTDLMANPQSFVQGARQYNNASPGGSSGGAGVTGRGTGTTGTGTTGTSTNPATTPHEPTKPNQ